MKVKEGGRKVRVRVMPCEEDQPLLALKVEEGARSRGMWAAGKVRKPDPLLQPPERDTALPSLWFQAMRHVSLTYRTGR